MNKKVNFASLEIQSIDGSNQKIDINDELANLIYMQGQSINECELGRRIYNAGRNTDGKLSPDADRTIELSPEDMAIVNRVLMQFPYIIRQAVSAAIDTDA